MALFLLCSLASPCRADEPVPFHEGVLAALSRHGCSAGACHGSPTGKGGFRLSLRGFDPVLDETTLIREDFGRRVNPHDPDASLLLLKPLMQVSHGGGQKLKKSDPAYRILRAWIAQGARPDRPGSVACQKIEVQPKTAELKHPEWQLRLKVIGHFSDGTTREVTHLSVFSSSDESVATADVGRGSPDPAQPATEGLPDQPEDLRSEPRRGKRTPPNTVAVGRGSLDPTLADGQIAGQSRGEATILVRYLEHIDTADLLFHQDVPGFAWVEPPRNNFIDEHVAAKLKRLQIVPAALSGDHEFVRRIYLDCLGILPSKAEVVAFVGDPSPEKRNELIDALLARPEFAERMAQHWADLLRVKAGKLGAPAAHKMHRWLVEAMQQNMPYDELVRTLLTAEGSTLTSPPANFFRAAAETTDCAEATAQLFLAARIQCAKCHNHPFDRWSQDHYYSLGAFFARVQRKATSRDGELIVFAGPTGETIQPRTGKLIEPSMPGASNLSLVGHSDRRAALADWLTAPDNRHFARVGANRIWGWLFGRGIVEPVDDMRDSNPPANAELLDALALDFAGSGFDQKHLARTILRSHTYQRSSRITGMTDRHAKYFAVYPAHLLPAEQLLDAISRVTGVAQDFPGLPAGTRASQLPTPELGGDFLRVFGQPGRDTVCDCERGKEPKLTQPLTLLNGGLISDKLRDRRSKLAAHLDELAPRLAAAGSPPTSGLVLWLRADEGIETEQGGVARDGALVSRWLDRSGGNRHPAQSDASFRPRYVARAVADLPTVRFDGLDDFLTNAADNLVESGQPRTVLAVGRVAKEGRGGAIVSFRRSTTGGGTVFAAQHINLGGVYYVYSDGVNGAGNSTLPLTGFGELKQPFVTTFVSRGAGQKLFVAVNGREQPVSQLGAVGPDAGAAGFTIGSREDIPAGAQNWSGDLAEVLVYDRELSADELKGAGSYLATKYAVRTEYPNREVAVSAASAATQEAADRAFLADFYFAAFSRAATADELDFALKHAATIGNRREGLEDVCWAVLNSKEFLFQH